MNRLADATKTRLLTYSMSTRRQNTYQGGRAKWCGVGCLHGEREAPCLSVIRSTHCFSTEIQRKGLCTQTRYRDRTVKAFLRARNNKVLYISKQCMMSRYHVIRTGVRKPIQTMFRGDLINI